MIVFTLAVLFLGSLLFGQFGNISIFPGVSLYLHDIVLFFLLGGMLIFGKPKKQLRRSFLLLPIAGFFCTAFISLVANSVRFPFGEVLSGSLYLFRWIYYASIFFVVVYSSLNTEFWEWGIYAIGVVFALLGFAQMIILPGLRMLIPLGWDEHYGRLFSTFFDPNFTGIFLVMIFFEGLHLLKIHKRQKVILWFGQILMGIAIVLTYSRSTYIGLLAGFVVWLLGSKQYKGIIFIFFLVLVFLVIPQGGRDVNRINRDISSVARINNWRSSLVLTMRSPVVGNGFNMLRAIASGERAIDQNGVVSHDAAGVDNSLLFVLATTGIVGFAIYCWLLSQFFGLLYKGFGFSGIAILLALITHSFFNNSLFYAWTMLLLWILLGIAEKKRVNAVDPKIVTKKTKFKR